MIRLGLLSAVTLLVSSAFAASWTSTPFSPASVPLAVRTPYLSAWLPQGPGKALNDDWPRFWAGAVSQNLRGSLCSSDWHVFLRLSGGLDI